MQVLPILIQIFSNFIFEYCATKSVKTGILSKIYLNKIPPFCIINMNLCKIVKLYSALFKCPFKLVRLKNDFD